MSWGSTRKKNILGFAVQSNLRFHSYCVHTILWHLQRAPLKTSYGALGLWCIDSTRVQVLPPIWWWDPNNETTCKTAGKGALSKLSSDRTCQPKEIFSFFNVVWQKDQEVWYFSYLSLPTHDNKLWKHEEKVTWKVKKIRICTHSASGSLQNVEVTDSCLDLTHDLIDTGHCGISDTCPKLPHLSTQGIHRLLRYVTIQVLLSIRCTVTSGLNGMGSENCHQERKAHVWCDAGISHSKPWQFLSMDLRVFFDPTSINIWDWGAHDTQ